MPQPDLTQAFVRPIEEAGISYFVTGSIAAMHYGEPRLTHDVDLVLTLSAADIQRFCTLFPLQEYYCPPAEVIGLELRRRPFGHFNLIHHDSGLKADCYPNAGDPLHGWAFANRKRVALSEKESIWLAPIEYVIVRKLQYFREGGSQKHVDDIRKMLLVSGDLVDRAFLRSTLAELQLTSFWSPEFPLPL
jgi:hypothetical protein